MDGQRREDGSPVGPFPWQRQGAVYDTRPPAGARPVGDLLPTSAIYWNGCWYSPAWM
jgi:hypothetical protein